MKVGIMQPYFAPYIGYINLIKHTDTFILFDTVQFIRHGWIERNRMLKQDEGWLYIKVPLQKFSRDTLIKDIQIDNSTDWASKMKAQLIIYKKRAPFYKEVMDLLDNEFKTSHTSIVKLNQSLLKAIISYLGFSKSLPIFSEMNIEIETPLEADEWALNICKTLGNDIVYINPIGGMEFFNRDKYTAQNVNLQFQKMILPEYSQKRPTFETGLSILDVMMFNDPKAINQMLDQFELL